MFAEADLIPISALQHWAFCPRQCGLIHLEGLWAENRLTAEGKVLHDQAHNGAGESRGRLRIERGLALRSLSLGLTGKADVVEFHREAWGWQPFPVEYKRGRPKSHDADRLQLCAQAVCLEEMLQVAVPHGALFYGATRRRQEVDFDERLRGSWPRPWPRCEPCSSRVTPPGGLGSALSQLFPQQPVSTPAKRSRQCGPLS